MKRFKGFFSGTLKLMLGMVIITPLISCSFFQNSTSGNNDEFVINIQEPEDLKELDKIETILTVTPEKAAYHPEYQIVEEIAVPFVPEYRLGPGDVIEVVYHIKYDEPIENYLLEIEDKISINFPYHPQFSSTVLVRTDGKITVPLVGDIMAESKSPEELAAILNQKYSPYLNNPSITVALEEFNVKIRELKRAITTASRGQSKIAPVTPDGRISFPIIGSIHAEGFTIDQIEKLVNEKYAVHVRNLNATLILLEINHPRIYIFGEVQSPGAYDLKTRTNILDALAMANGYTPQANLKEVAVFRNEGLERPIAFKINLEHILKTGAAQSNMMLKPADIIFVPKGKLDEFNDFMEKVFTKGIYAIMPFTTTYSWNPRIDGAD